MQNKKGLLRRYFEKRNDTPYYRAKGWLVKLILFVSLVPPIAYALITGGAIQHDAPWFPYLWAWLFFGGAGVMLTWAFLIKLKILPDDPLEGEGENDGQS